VEQGKEGIKSGDGNDGWFLVPLWGQGQKEKPRQQLLCSLGDGRLLEAKGPAAAAACVHASLRLCSAAIISRLIISHGTVFFSPNKSAVQISTSGL